VNKYKIKLKDFAAIVYKVYVTLTSTTTRW